MNLLNRSLLYGSLFSALLTLCLLPPALADEPDAPAPSSKKTESTAVEEEKPVQAQSAIEPNENANASQETAANTVVNNGRCKAQDAEEQYQLALKYVFDDRKTEENEAKAFTCFDAAAKQGLMDAQYNLGLFYNMGTGVSRNAEQARYWLEQSAKQGHAGAQLALGSLYEFGHGGDQDKTLARYWYEKSAEQGNEQAQYFLALIYLDGAGIAKNPQEAYFWALVADENGHLSARGLAQRIALNLGESQQAMAEERAEDWQPRRATSFEQPPDLNPREESVSETRAQGAENPREQLAYDGQQEAPTPTDKEEKPSNQEGTGEQPHAEKAKGDHVDHKKREKEQHHPHKWYWHWPF